MGHTTAHCPRFSVVEEKVRALAPVILALSILPVAAVAAPIDASLVPDGTYTVTVEKVQDPQHIVVLMDNGTETTLTASGSADFSKIKAPAKIKCSIIKGHVPVFLVTG
jgi:hypothetical protein